MEKLITLFEAGYGEPGYHFVFEVDGEEVGSCGVIAGDNYIHSVRVVKQYRNRGYARAMLRAVMERFAGQRMWLRVATNNIPAIKAYNAIGFTTFKVSDGDYDYCIMSMEMTAPGLKPKTCQVYGLAYESEEYSFKNESDRAEFALSLWEEEVYNWWMRYFNYYGSVPAFELLDHQEFIAEEICCFDVIHVED